MNRERIIVIDDEEDMLENCRRLLSRIGYDDVVTTTSPHKALEMIREAPPVLVITDLRMPEMDGIELLSEIKKINPAIIVIVFTAFASVETAIKAVKDGAFDYISKPFSYDSFSIAIDRAFSKKRLAEENVVLRRQIQKSFKFDKIIGASTALLKVIDTIRKVSDTEANILIQGESGTGKELIARSIHTNSRRDDKPFIPVDCAALPKNLLETELFGHEKGAFTGANNSRAGLFELANSGTFFIDEVGEMHPGTQVKLLRAIQERKIRRVGGSKLIDLDIRLISATNRILEDDVKSGTFREDLFFRLNVINIDLPPLRDRHGDVELIAEHYLQHFLEYTDKKITGFTRETIDTLNKYQWPGNIRELQNVVERAVSLTNSDMIGIEDLPRHLRENTGMSFPSIHTMPGKTFLPYKLAKKKWSIDSEKEYLAGILKKNKWNITRAAQEAEIDRKTLYKLIKKHDLPQAE